MATFGASGSLAAPLLFAGGPGADAVTVRLWALTLFALAVTLLPLLVVPAATAAGGASLLASLRLLRERPLAGLIALLALEFGAEAVLAGWTAAYAIAVFPGASGGVAIGLYWGGLLAGRLCAPLLLARMPKLVLVLGGAATTCGAIAIMATAPVPGVLAGAAFLAGFDVGPLAPTIVSVAGDRYPRQMGAAIGVLLSVAQIGGMVLPWLTGQVTIAYGYRAGLTVPALAALGIAAGTLLAWQARARRVPVAVEARVR
jgi:predicted MFS family arabinose efflux permease